MGENQGTLQMGDIVPVDILIEVMIYAEYRGWINYFKIGSMKGLCERLDSNIRYRLD